MYTNTSPTDKPADTSGDQPAKTLITGIPAGSMSTEDMLRERTSKPNIPAPLLSALRMERLEDACSRAVPQTGTS
ncbi:hypothetical protein Pst134EA_032066 [Puccinia striiformis f. sp. tritici]|uniref:uncharacterized protein n=1 Tax=Puccinia striiformis f. sp. tritici TaxID=168172 RepID=UPI00200894A2|nr:uncharacterized protein Pst134EA_032066 [Puccinia striiformis f. sp. tritici]KAH9441935.1 hypothetical protein Pst134EA_032066 [Puccinia striiformis f. sp. tritici]